MWHLQDSKENALFLQQESTKQRGMFLQLKNQTTEWKNVIAATILFFPPRAMLYRDLLDVALKNKYDLT